MAHAPAASLIPNGGYRVVRIQKHVTEAYIVAGSIAEAVTAAKALPQQDWITRPVLQTQPGLEDEFEYDVISSDV